MLVAALNRAAALLAWRQTYTRAQVGAAFLDNYGWTELIGLRGPVPGTTFACGFLLLGPRTHYPKHSHEAEELYIPLAGTAEWLQGDGRWRRHAPLTLIQHHSHEPHAMRTAAEPLLALYLWRSANLEQKAQLTS